MSTTYHGLHNRFTAQAGHGDTLEQILLAAVESLRTSDACRLYLVSRSPDDPDVIWVTEAWTSKAAHDASLHEEATQAATQQARPLIVGITGTELPPLGGKGL